MKSLLALSFFVFSSALFAMPSVGDMAVYKIKSGGYDIVQKVELISFNSSDNTYTQKETNSVMGQVSVNLKVVSADTLSSEANLSNLLTYCESTQVNGKLENVTVPAGTFRTCNISTDDQGNANLGVVPFGIVKFTNPSASVELVEFKIVR